MKFCQKHTDLLPRWNDKPKSVKAAGQWKEAVTQGSGVLFDFNFPSELPRKLQDFQRKELKHWGASFFYFFRHFILR